MSFSVNLLLLLGDDWLSVLHWLGDSGSGDQGDGELEALGLHGLDEFNGGEEVILTGDVDPVVSVVLVGDRKLLWGVGFLDVFFGVNFSDNLLDLRHEGLKILWEDSLSFDDVLVVQLEGWGTVE